MCTLASPASVRDSCIPLSHGEIGLGSTAAWVIGNIIKQSGLSCTTPYRYQRHSVIDSLTDMTSCLPDRFCLRIWHFVCHRRLCSYFWRTFQPVCYHRIHDIQRLPTPEGCQVLASVLLVRGLSRALTVS